MEMWNTIQEKQISAHFQRINAHFNIYKPFHIVIIINF